MNLKQLHALREVMLTGSVSEAARNLSRTQPSVSGLIAGLERDLGVELFDRRGGRLQPVPEADYLFHEASAILDRLAVLERTMRGLRDLEQGTLKVVSMPGPGTFLLPRLISEFVTGRADIRVELISRSSPQVRQLVAAQQYDVGIADIGFAGERESPLVKHETLHLECACALRADDPLAAKPELSPADLDGRPMAVLYQGHPIHQNTRNAFADRGANFNLRFETQYFISLLTFVEQGLAYAIVDPLSIESYRQYRGAPEPTGGGGIVFRRFRPKVELVSSIMTPVHRPLSRIARAFIEILRADIRRIERASPVVSTG